MQASFFTLRLLRISSLQRHHSTLSLHILLHTITFFTSSFVHFFILQAKWWQSDSLQSDVTHITLFTSSLVHFANKVMACNFINSFTKSKEVNSFTKSKEVNSFTHSAREECPWYYRVICVMNMMAKWWQANWYWYSHITL